MANAKPLRCAIYTRKSSEEGLEQDYNSLHAQRDACEAFIRSQKHEGWQLVPTAYDDGGISGGTMERPGIQRLLTDIQNRRIDVVVVYKVDRLTRSLADFARMVELFDAHGVSFVSVTQQFNTTNSMGRLTLNVLLSFAQFEREVTGERIRDKIAASKQKGMWMGGNVPLGYVVKDRKLYIEPADAAKAHTIFTRYLELNCVRELYHDLIDRDIRSVRGHIISRGTLYKMLSNPIYIGQIRHKGSCYSGQHEAIIDMDLWNLVQEHTASLRIGSKTQSRKTERGPLDGKLYDATGERLVTVYGKKRERRYRYYVSVSLRDGLRQHEQQGWRLPGLEVDQMVEHAINPLLRDKNLITSHLQQSDLSAADWPRITHALGQIATSNAIATLLQRVTIHDDHVQLQLSIASLVAPDTEAPIITHTIPIQMKRRGVEMRLVIDNGITARKDLNLIKTIARAHAWWGELLHGQVKTCAAIAAREKLDAGYVSRVLDLAFLAPDIVEAIVGGYQPADLTAQHLLRGIKLPLDWAEQRRMLGMA